MTAAVVTREGKNVETGKIIDKAKPKMTVETKGTTARKRKTTKTSTVTDLNTVDTLDLKEGDFISEDAEAMKVKDALANTFSIAGKKVASINVKLIRVERKYQKPAIKHHVNLLAENWDIDKCDFIVLNLRDGKLYVMDGQHRLEAAKLRGITHLPCIIYENMTIEEEALWFARQRINNRYVSVFETFNANIVNGNYNDPIVRIDMDIKEVCDKYHVVTCQYYKEGRDEKTLRSLSKARTIVRTNGKECFEWIIRTINNTEWATCPLAYSKEFLIMLRRFYVDNQNNLDTMTMYAEKVMNAYTPMQIDGKAAKDHSEYGYPTRMHITFNELVKEAIYR